MSKALARQTLFDRFKHPLVLPAAVLLSSGCTAGMRALEYVLRQPKQRRDTAPSRFLFAAGTWMLGGIATGVWRWPDRALPRTASPSTAKREP